MYGRRARPSVALIAALGVAACSTEVKPFARAVVIEDLADAIGGEMGVAQPGDFLLENDQIRVSILSGRVSMGPSLYGGSLVDADLQWADPSTEQGNGRDQWNELFPLASMNVPFASAPGDVFVAEGGSESAAAVVRVQGASTPFLSLLDLLWGIVGMPDMWMVTDYVVEPGVPWVTIRTTVSFENVSPLPVDGTPVNYPLGGLDVVGVGLQDGIVMGDFFLAGGSLDVFAPGIGFDEDGAVYDRLVKGENAFVDPFEFPWVAAIGDGISYGIVPVEGSAYVPLFTASQTAIVGGIQDATKGTACTESPFNRFCVGDAFTYERLFFIGHGDVGSIVDRVLEARPAPHGTVSGRVVEEGTGRPLGQVDVFAYACAADASLPCAEQPYNQWRTDVRPDDSVPDGSFGGKLPVGDWELLVHRLGRADPERVRITVGEGEEVTVRLGSPIPGTITFFVTDEKQRRVPAKVTIFREDAPSSRQPALGDGFIAGNPEWVVFADQGTGELPLPPGTYRAIASRGIEYEIDESEPFVVDGRTSRHIEFVVRRAIDSEGWISADLHVHSEPSHDSGVTLPDRVRTMVAEGVEFFASTDHDYMTDFAPVIEDMGLTEWVQTAVGVETTTIEVGHFLAFPLQARFLADVGGAQDWTGKTPQQIIDFLRQQGAEVGFDPLVFVAHPRDGILGYFDQFGFDPFKGTPATAVSPPGVEYDPSLAGIPNPNPILADGNLTLDIDAMEMFTGKRLDTHRTPTVDELEAYAAAGSDEGWGYKWMERTMAEQQGLVDGVFRLSEDSQGVIDDWFTLLNLGYRITAIGNSDTHGTSSIEAGCPRNFVVSSTDEPAYIDDQEVADAVKAHKVIASYGPFVQLWMGDATIGDSVEASGPQTFTVLVQAPSWIEVDRVELYENGQLIHEFLVPADGPSTERLLATFEHTPSRDAWYVAIAMGEGSMAPVFTSVELPYLPLDEVVSSALGGIPLVGAALGEPIPFPKLYDVHPYAITNPIWVDVDGGGWLAPGLPTWLVPGARP